MTIVSAACEFLRSFDGHSAKPSAPKDQRERLSRFMLPNDSLVEGMAYLGFAGPPAPTSSCELFGLGFLRVLEIDNWRLDFPYIPERLGKAGQDLRAVGLDAGLWEEKTEALCTMFSPGDIVLLRSPEHAACVVDYEEGDGTLVCCDGGQGDGRDIAIVRRKLIVPNGIPWLVHSDKPYRDEAQKIPNGRRVVGALRGSRR